MIGVLTSSYAFSTKKYTGSVITDRFTATDANQKTVMFLTKDNKEARLNSLTIEADSADLYFTVIKQGQNPATHVFTDEPVLFVASGEKMNLSGLEAIGIKFSNASGARYFIQGIGF